MKNGGHEHGVTLLGAILVNPFNTDAMALALYEALHMPEADRECERRLFTAAAVNRRFTCRRRTARRGTTT